MATSSFSKYFVLDNRKAVKSFLKVMSTPSKPIEYKTPDLSPEERRKEEEEILKLLSR